MGQRRQIKQITYIEQTVDDALCLAVERQDSISSKSDYVRTLIINDLKTKGLLTDRIIAEMIG